MGEFEGAARTIQEHVNGAKDEGGIRVGDIPTVIGGVMGGTGGINIYPSTKKGPCYSLAVFVSLSVTGKKYARGHITCRQAIEKLVQHMQGSCYKKTEVAVLFVDNWDDNAYGDWKDNLEVIKSFAHIEAYLLAGKTPTKINI